MEPIKVLLADDHSEFRRVIHAFLSRLPNISVVGEAQNGEEAVQKVRQLTPDVVLMDISMPRQNGLEATRIIKEQMPGVKVLITTMHDNAFYRNGAAEVHADGFLVKSSLKSDLEPSIRSLFSPVQQLSRAAQVPPPLGMNRI